MNNNLYSIKVEREALRCNEQGKLSKLDHPEIFGDKNKNKFITIGKEESQIKIATPVCKNVEDCYIKLEEITDIVLETLKVRKELLWSTTSPCEGSNLNSVINVELTISEQSFDSDLYEAIMKKLESLREFYGNINLEMNDKRILVKNIEIDPYNRTGISKEYLMHLVLEILSVIFNVSDLEKLNQKYSLKCKEGIKIQKHLKLENNEVLKQAEENMRIGYDERYQLKHYPQLVAEAAALVKDALSQGIDYEVLNEITSVVELNYEGHKEIVVEGNKTNRDNYIFPIVTDDKMISKNMMKESGLNVPEAIILNKNMEQEEKQELLRKFYNTKVVIKPRNTNKGTGITVFSERANKEQITQAVEYAFQFDEDVLIEEYIKGMEYRFLVVNGKCISVCHRRAASVVGDGVSTIKQLIDAKNKEPWHALTYAPVKEDEPVEEYLKLQGYTYSSVPEKNKRIFLRTNSNVSTGGESLDVTAIVPEYFKRIAEKAADVFNGKISGVDLIIDDMKKKDYAIIEINDNPGYSINEWPYEGPGEKVGLEILKLLGY